MTLAHANLTYIEKRTVLRGGCLSTYRPLSTRLDLQTHSLRERRPAIRRTGIFGVESEGVSESPVFQSISRLVTGLFLFIISATAGVTLHFSLTTPTQDEELVSVEPLFEAPHGVEAPGKTALLKALSEQRTTQLQEHTHFVSSVIRSELPSHLNPEKLASTIVRESLQADIDPLFVAAVIRSESMFRYKALSGRGARGLMQIMPDTGKYLAKRNKIEWRGEHTLHEPETNLRLGIAYLKYLNEKFRGHRERVLIAYNWGPGNLSSALSQGSRIPGESVLYARKIITTHRQWKGAFTQFAANLTQHSTNPDLPRTSV